MLGITSIEDAGDLSGSRAGIVHLEVLEIKGHPAAVNKNAAFLALLIQVSVEGGNDLNALLAVSHLLNLNFLAVVEHASHLDLLE